MTGNDRCPTVRWGGIVRGALFALLCVSGEVRAQVVRGHVTDRDAARPISGARLYLIADGGEAVDSTRATPDGVFRLGATLPGFYRLHFQMDGWATYTSERIALAADTVDHDFQVPLVSNAVLQQMSDMIAADPRLQEALPELCGEELRTADAGLVVGVVRERRTRVPVAGARVAIGDRSTVSNERGVYILCNVPLGSDVEVLVERPDGTRAITPVEVRRGMISWYDLFV